MYPTSASNGSSTSMIDLRSDTVTKPTAAMREAMMSADVGDDVYGDDPTVRLLEEKVADLLGKEAGLFVSSGTQSNLIALLCHCGRGEEVISGDCYHILKYEAGGSAVLGGVANTQLAVDEHRGLTADSVKAAIKVDDPHFPISKLVSLENTVYGRVQDQDGLDTIADMAHNEGLSVHLDGARLMNAAVKSNRSAAELVQKMDTVSLCLSKGLGAPVGSVLSGSKDFIKKARRNRKLLGGGMRQSGVLAAAGLHALDHHVDRLAEDHQRAQDLADMIDQYEALTVHRDQLDTNMVFVSIAPEHIASLHQHMKDEGIIFGNAASEVRLVTHLDIDDNAMAKIGAALDKYFN